MLRAPNTASERPDPADSAGHPDPAGHPDHHGGWLGFAAAVAGVASVLVLTLLPSAPSPTIVGVANVDKLLHAGAWGLLALLTYRPFFGRRALLCWAALVAFGILIELAQAFLPPRSADAWDAVSDACGAALGVLALRAWGRRRTPVLAPSDLSEREPMG